MSSETTCDCPDNRTLFDIVWSCFSTIFICTWVSVHPNLPRPGETFFWISLKRVKLMLYTFIVPELTLTWAMSQWFGARKIADNFKDRGWTTTHGFFIVMGGFHLHRGEEDLGVLSVDLLTELDASGEIEFPTISTRDIEDKSKGDFLAKAMVVLQTSWFIIQCIARGAQGLALTELELLTVALASLNAGMYFFWWSKPLDVQAYVAVYLKPSASIFMHQPELKRTLLSSEAKIERAIKNANLAGSTQPLSRFFGAYLPLSFRKGAVNLFIHISDFLDKRRDEWKYRNRFLFILKWFLFAPLILPIIPIIEIIGDLDDFKPGSNRVPTFYAPPRTKRQEIAIAATYGLFGVVVGGIHMIAWSFPFPSRIARTVWHVAALSVTCLPLLGTALQLTPGLEDRVVAAGNRVPGTQWRDILLDWLAWWSSLAVSLALAAYLPARLILLVESLLLLKNLSPGAYLEVTWTRFIPHIQ